MDANSSTYIDRQTASQLLQVSVRTVDRYIRGGKLWALSENGRIWLDRKEILAFSHPRKVSKNVPIDRSVSIPVLRNIGHDNDFYRDLYEEAKQTLGGYQQKLEQANYRIGQLESQILQPSVSKHIERHDDSFSSELLRKEIHDREKEITLLKELAKRERTSRVIFAALTYLLLVLLPTLWYLLR